jgi:xanthine dehydrogenase YagR molybdenum-binding subunit
MKFDTPAGTNPIDRLHVIGQPVDRIDGPLKTTGAAPYAYEQPVAHAAYGHIVGAAIARGRIVAIDTRAALDAAGVLAVVTHENAGPLGRGEFYVGYALAGPAVAHYHQAVAIVVAETFEQARAAAQLVAVEYAPEKGAFSLAHEKAAGREQPFPKGRPQSTKAGDFATAFATAEVTVDASFSTPDQSHAMMEPHAAIAAWDGDELTVHCTIQLLSWGARDLGKTLGIDPKKVRLMAPYIGGGFGGKGTVLADAVLAALGSKHAGRPVKVALARPLMFNNTTHRPATLQRIRIGAGRDGKITAIGHDSWSGNLAGGAAEQSVLGTRVLYAGANRMTSMHLARLDLPEGHAMRAPGEAPGMMALEIAMDEMAEKLGLDPVQFRAMNDTQVDPEKPSTPFSQRDFLGCLRLGAEQFGWHARAATPAARMEGDWLVGMGMAGAVRGAPVTASGARASLDADGAVTIACDMTDIGTGSYTIIAQTAAEMLGVPVDRVVVKLGDTRFPVAAGSGGQWGAASSTAGVYAACARLRELVAAALDLDPATAVFEGGQVRAGGRSAPLANAGVLTAEDRMEYGDLSKEFAQQTFGAHFCEVAVHALTGAIRVKRMLAVCSAGRILNPKTARSQIIGGMTMGIGAALMEELVVDQRHGFFVNHDLAGYEVPVHADVPHLDVVFLDEVDATMTPLKAKGVGELGISGAAAAVANAIYNATGVRVRDYPITLDKLLPNLPEELPVPA